MFAPLLSPTSFERGVCLELLDACSVEDLSLCSPDEGGFLQVYSGMADVTFGSLKAEFGMSALMLPCWTCLFGQVDEANRAAMKKLSPGKLMKVAAKLAAQHDNVNPNMKSLSLNLA